MPQPAQPVPIPCENDRTPPGVETLARRIYRLDGGRVDPLDVQPEDISLPEIARRLARRYRFAAASPWTVAEHGLAAAAWAEAENLPDTDLRCALLHDAAEAWLGDVPSPMKPGVRFWDTSYEDAENAILRALAGRYGWDAAGRVPPLPPSNGWDADDRVPPLPPSIRKIDRRLCEMEAAYQFGRLTLLTRERFLALLDPHGLRRDEAPPSENLIVDTFLVRAEELGLSD